jgi:hypothetical protein|tara:strand:+ start:205 stop:492 length:288 start_codon:yes stop_codon:yes gene_type:complete
MPHPSDALPKDVYVLNGTNKLIPPNGKFVFAITNPTASAVNATVKGSIYNYDSGTSSYKQIASTATDIIPVQAGATLYGRFTEVNSAADVLCYVG